MTPDSVSAALAKAITECLKRSGRPAPRIDPNVRVIEGVEEFDSLCGIETTLELETILGIELSDNIFIKEIDGRPRARTFTEVVEAILRISQGGNNAGHKKH